ncbi:MAG: hypothetical protein WC635_01025 [Bacteriovorax sp.]|jgi:hypothetical protein
MKFLPLTLLVLSTSFAAQAGVIDLRAQGKTGTFCPTQEMTYNLSENNYVEKMLVSADGRGRNGFIKVYADGEFVFNIGVPGVDPDYTFRIRRHVQNITLKFEETCSAVHDVKLFTSGDVKAPEGYRSYNWQNHTGYSWGNELLEIVRSLSLDFFEQPDFMTKLYPEVLLPMKKIAILEDVSEAVRDERSMITGVRALKMAKIIVDNEAFLDKLLERGKYDYLVRDLLRIKEDILEKYDVKEKNLAREIKNLEAQLAD